MPKYLVLPSVAAKKKVPSAVSSHVITGAKVLTSTQCYSQRKRREKEKKEEEEKKRGDKSRRPRKRKEKERNKESWNKKH